MGGHGNAAKPLTATGCLQKLRADMRAVDDIASKKKRRQVGLSPSATAALVGSLDEEPPKKTAGKAYNVYLQLADASGTSAPPSELNPNDVPAWRTKMCKNRIAILQTERKKLEAKKRLVQLKIEEKLEAQQRAAADLTWKKKEIEYVSSAIGSFRSDIAKRESEVAEHQQQQRAALRTATSQIGDEMRTDQKERESTMLGLSEFYLAEKRRKNLEATKTQTLTLYNLYESIAADKTAGGVRLRELRDKNTQTIKNVAAADLARVQALNETVKEEQEMSATRLREKLAATQSLRTEEYLKNRTQQFNEFKKAASVTNNMQQETAAIVEQLRETFETTRDLERRLNKL